MDFDDLGALDDDPFAEYGVALPLAPVADPDAPLTQGEPAAPGPPEHHSVQMPAPVHDVYAPHPPRRPMRPPPHARQPYNTQAVGAMPAPGSPHHLGVSLLLVGGSAFAGARMGGWAGGVAGALGAGAAINGVRAIKGYRQGDPAGQKEGSVSAFYTLVGGAGAAFLWHKYANKSMRPNVAQEDDDSPFTDTPCGIRPVGP